MTAETISAFVLDKLAREGRPTSEADTAQFVALLIATEYPDADDAVVRDAIRLVNDHASVSNAITIVSGDGLRSIEPINTAGLDIGEPENIEPICMSIDPKALFVDPTYQRGIGERGLRRIRQMVEAWDWNKFQPPACAYAVHDGQTVLKVLDGQHTSIAAASHPMISEIPVMIHEARETEKQADAFVGQNTGRLAVTALQLYAASLTAKDEDALTIAQVCERAGVTILRSPPRHFKAGDTIAVQAISRLVDGRGAMKARMILEVLVKAGMTPILSPQIKAVELLMCDQEYCDDVTTDALISTISGDWTLAHDEATKLKVKHKWPFWMALAIHWFRNTPKVRKTRRSER